MVAAAEAVVDAEVAALDPAQAPKSRAQGRKARPSLRVALGVFDEHPHPFHPLGRLRENSPRGGEQRRPGRDRHEVAPPHSIALLAGATGTITGPVSFVGSMSSDLSRAAGLAKDVPTAVVDARPQGRVRPLGSSIRETDRATKRDRTERDRLAAAAPIW
jgi:hypothetical protein